MLFCTRTSYFWNLLETFVAAVFCSDEFISFNSITKRHIILDFKTLSIHLSVFWFPFGFVSMSLPLTSSQSSVQALWFIAHTTGSKKLVRFRLLYQSFPEPQDINKHGIFRLNMVIKGHISWLLHLATKRQEKICMEISTLNWKLYLSIPWKPS